MSEKKNCILVIWVEYGGGIVGMRRLLEGA